MINNSLLSDAHLRVLQRANNILINVPPNYISADLHTPVEPNQQIVQNPSSYLRHDLNKLYLADNAPASVLVSNLPQRTKSASISRIPSKIAATRIPTAQSIVIPINNTVPIDNVTSINNAVPIDSVIPINTVRANTVPINSEIPIKNTVFGNYANNATPVNLTNTPNIMAAYTRNGIITNNTNSTNNGLIKNNIIQTSNIIPASNTVASNIVSTNVTPTIVDSLLTVKNNGPTILKLNLVSSIFDPTFNLKQISGATVTKNSNNSVDLIIMFSNSTGSVHYPQNPLN